MDIKQNYREELVEEISNANGLEEILGSEIPCDLVIFKSIYGGIDMVGQPPFLLLNPRDLATALGEFRQFYSYEDIIIHQQNVREGSEYQFELDKRILKIASCEEQIDIYIGYEDGGNLNKIVIYNWDEDDFYSIDSLDILLSDYLVDYDENLF